MLEESGQVYFSCTRIPGSLLFSFSTRGTARPCLLACLLRYSRERAYLISLMLIRPWYFNFRRALPPRAALLDKSRRPIASRASAAAARPTKCGHEPTSFTGFERVYAFWLFWICEIWCESSSCCRQHPPFVPYYGPGARVAARRPQFEYGSAVHYFSTWTGFARLWSTLESLCQNAMLGNRSTCRNWK